MLKTPKERREGQKITDETISILQRMLWSLPEPANHEGGRRYLITAPFASPDNRPFFKVFWRRDIPVKAYALQVDKHLIRVEYRNSVIRRRAIRKTIEATDAFKFTGARGFYQQFLKHLTPAAINDTNRKQYFPVQRRRKINQPAFNLNPAMKTAFCLGSGQGAVHFVTKSKNNLVSVIKAKCDRPHYRICF